MFRKLSVLKKVVILVTMLMFSGVAVSTSFAQYKCGNAFQCFEEAVKQMNQAKKDLNSAEKQISTLLRELNELKVKQQSDIDTTNKKSEADKVELTNRLNNVTDELRKKIPVGTIAAYWGATAPAGWLMCNSSDVPPGAEYDALRNMTGKTPDLRGMFLRGVNSGRADVWKDPDERGIGSLQPDEFKSHTHTLHEYSVYADPRKPYSVGSFPGEQIGTWGNSNGYMNAYIRVTGFPTNPSGGSEIRPKNVAVNYIIKY